MSATDPLHTVWKALDRHGCQPHGELHSFRARCPACEGNSCDSLAVNVGADGRALIWCFRCQRSAVEIAAAVGLTPYDLFPAGHRYGNPFLTLPEASRSEFAGNARTAVNVIKGLDDAELLDRTEIIARECPYCGHPHARVVIPNEGQPFVHCESGCSWRGFSLALAGLVADRGSR